MATSTLERRSSSATAVETLEAVTYSLGALLLTGEAVVHAEQFASGFSGVAWIGPLFLANAVACVAAIVALAYARIRVLGALAGIVISTAALLGLVVSYGQGLFGWQEGGFRPEVAAAALTEAGAVIVLSAALALHSAWLRFR